MTKVKVKATVSFTKEFVMDMAVDYPECKSIDDVIAYEKEGILGSPEFVVDDGELKVEVTAERI
jgi:hypothetical protein